MVDKVQLGSLKSGEFKLRAFIFAGAIPFGSNSNELRLPIYVPACIPGLHDRLIRKFKGMVLSGSHYSQMRQELRRFVRQLLSVYR